MTPGIEVFGGGGGGVSDGAVDLAKLATTVRDPWAPGGLGLETLPGAFRMNATGALSPVSGTLYVAGGIVIPRGVTVSNISFRSANASVTPANQWFCLTDQSRNVLAKTVDDTTTAWAAATVKTLALAAPYTPSVDTPVYVGVVQVAATPATLRNVATSTGGPGAIAPILGGSSTAGLTTPASLGAAAAALTENGAVLYAYLS